MSLCKSGFDEGFLATTITIGLTPDVEASGGQLLPTIGTPEATNVVMRPAHLESLPRELVATLGTQPATRDCNTTRLSRLLRLGVLFDVHLIHFGWYVPMKVEGSGKRM